MIWRRKTKRVSFRSAYIGTCGPLYYEGARAFCARVSGLLRPAPSLAVCES